MDLHHRRRLPSKPPRRSSSTSSPPAVPPPARPVASPEKEGPTPSQSSSSANRIRVQIQASDALPIPIRHTNKLFSALFMASLYFLMSRWRDKIRTSSPLHLLSLSEILAVSAFLSSLIYLISFFGIAYVQSFISSHDDDDDQQQTITTPPPVTCPLLETASTANPSPQKTNLSSMDDEAIVRSVVAGSTPSYILESKLGDTLRAAKLRRESLKLIIGRGMEGLPLDGFDYDSILGQCCEMPVGYVQLPVGIAGPLVLDGRVYYVPMATTEGCLVASTNRGCKAIGESGGAMSVVLRDGMTRAPVVRFGTAKRAAELKFFVEDPENFETLGIVFNRYLRCPLGV